MAFDYQAPNAADHLVELGVAVDVATARLVIAATLKKQQEDAKKNGSLSARTNNGRDG